MEEEFQPKKARPLHRKSLFVAGAVSALLLPIVIGSAVLAVRRSEKSALASGGNHSAAALGGASTEKAGTSQTTAAVPAAGGNNAISAPISGTYEMKGSTVNVADNGQKQEQSRTGLLRVVQQAGDKFTFALNADLVIDETSGNVHTGELTGEAEVRNGEAVFAYDRGNYDQCRIMMKFGADKIELEQTQACDFGTGVDASGTYTKSSSEVPNPSDDDDK